MEDFLKFIGFIFVFVFATSLLVLLCAAIVVPINIKNCNELGKQTGHETQWEFWGGGSDSCIIKINGEWIPTSNWIYNNGK